MKILNTLCTLLLTIVGISVQQCSIKDLSNIDNPPDDFGHQMTNVTNNTTDYECLSIYVYNSSINVTLSYSDPNNMYEVQYMLQCNNSVWETIGNISTTLRSNSTKDNCYDADLSHNNPQTACDPKVSTCLSELYSYGHNYDDSTIGLSDAVSPPVNLTKEFVLFNEAHLTIYVYRNGLISMGMSFSNCILPSKFPINDVVCLIAPYWTDVDSGGNESVYYRVSTDRNLIKRVSKDVQRAFSNSKFEPTILFIATWDDVSSRQDQTHTFQCVLATNEVESFMIFLYADETIQQPKNDSIDGSGGLGEFSGLGDFSGDGSGDRSSDGSGSGEEIEAVAGFDTDDYYYNIPGSATAQIGNIAQTSNVGIPGMWIFNSANYTVTVVSDPPGVPVDGINNTNTFGYLVGSHVRLTCLVIPTPPANSTYYNWNCSAGCSADTGMEQSMNFTDNEIFSCSVVINDVEYCSGTYELESLELLAPIVTGSGGDVEDEAIINYFDDEDTLTLTCRSLNKLDNVQWKIVNMTGSVQLYSRHFSDYVSRITFNNPSNNFSAHIRCSSNRGLSHKNFSIKKGNPYYELLTNESIIAPLASSPVISVIIAIDSDGTRSQQDNITNSLVFTHTSNNGDVVNVDGLEQDRVNFQLYHYTFPPVTRLNSGTYTIKSSISDDLEIRINLDVDESDIILIPSMSSIIILEGNSLNISCTPSIPEAVLSWSHSMNNLTQRDGIIFFPPSLNHTLSFEKLKASDSGIYTCRVAIDNPVFKENINLTVIPACSEDFSGGLFWSNSRQNLQVTQPCSVLHSSFRSGVTIGRNCQNDSTWSSVDLTNCTMFAGSSPVVVVYFTVIFDGLVIVDENEIIKNVSEHNITSIDIPEGRSTFSGSKLHVSISYNPVMTLEDEVQKIKMDLQANQNELFSPGINVVNETFNVIAFRPNSSCSCNKTERTVRTICAGPSTPPCVCTSSQSCKCNNDAYAGDGNVCGLDSDGDGFPDVGLDCDQSLSQCEEPLCQCEKDNCPKLYSKSDNGQEDISFCEEGSDNHAGCPFGRDITWKITWPRADVGKVVKQKCPGGSEAEGFAFRECKGKNNWGNPNVADCTTVEQIRLRMRAQELNNLAERIAAGDFTQALMPEVVGSIAGELESLTDTPGPLLPNDVSSSADTMDTILSVTEFIIDDDTDQSFVLDVTMSVVGVLDSLFDKRNDISFQSMTMNDKGISASEQLLKNTEQTGMLFSKSLSAADGQAFNASNNIIIGAQIFLRDNVDSNSNIEFFPPSSSQDSALLQNMTAMIQIPYSVIENQLNSTQAAEVPVAFAFARNSHLPTDDDQNLQSIILSSQITNNSIDLEGEEVVLTFIFKETDSDIQSIPYCAFFDVTNGTFSTAGIIQSNTSNSTFVQCNSTHLTSFAVLVDIKEEKETVSGSKALTIVSYFGCAISILCLLFTIVVLIAFRKNIFSQVQHFIHLNLSVTLLVGLVLFVSFIETASEYRAGCLIVAILLHFFFLAAFSWMLCEGILLFIVLHYVLYRGFFKSRKFFIMIGWGLPIPIVVISAAVSHEQYGIDGRCWMSVKKGTIWSFIGPMLIVILINMFFLLVTIRKVFTSKLNRRRFNKVSTFNTVKASLKAAIIVLPILGCTWVIGLLAINENTSAFAWIFTILNSLQGLFIMFFYVLRNEAFLKKINIFSKGGSHTSHTYSTHGTLPSGSKNRPNSSVDERSRLYSITELKDIHVISNEKTNAEHSLSADISDDLGNGNGDEENRSCSVTDLKGIHVISNDAANSLSTDDLGDTDTTIIVSNHQNSRQSGEAKHESPVNDTDQFSVHSASLPAHQYPPLPVFLSDEPISDIDGRISLNSVLEHINNLVITNESGSEECRVITEPSESSVDGVHSHSVVEDHNATGNIEVLHGSSVQDQNDDQISVNSTTPAAPHQYPALPVFLHSNEDVADEVV